MTKVRDFGQYRCIECGLCDEACPSARHGGIVPSSAVKAYCDRTEPSDVWSCLQCRRCDSACMEGVNVSGIIRAFRERSYESGTAPERFMRAEKQFLSELRMYPMIGRTVNQRKDLGLDTVPIDPEEEERYRSSLKELWGRE